MENGREPERRRFDRVVAIVVALETYRRPSTGAALPSVDFAHADADAIANVVKTTFGDVSEDDVAILSLRDGDASLAGLRDEVTYAIRGLTPTTLFIFYYAGHGFHAAGGNRLSTFDTNRTNVDATSFRLNEDLLEKLARSECRQSLIFVDACAEKFRDVLSSRDVVSNLEISEIEQFLDSGSYCAVFLSCSPGEKSYPASKLGHGVWTHFLLEALSGRATEALTRGRWLTDSGLRDYLRREVPRFITRETSIRGTQTPQATISATNTFSIRHFAPIAETPAEAALAGIKLRNNSEYLESVETGSIRRLDGFDRKVHTVPDRLSDSANSWCSRLLADKVAEELQELYEHAREALNARRRDLRKEAECGSGDLDTPAFRYSIETGQNPLEPEEYVIQRRLELRQGWNVHRAAIDELFGSEFDRLVIGFERLDDSFDDLVEKLEDVKAEHGGSITDNDRAKRVEYKRGEFICVFDLKKKRLEISFGRKGAIELIEAAGKVHIGVTNESRLLARPSLESRSRLKHEEPGEAE